MAHQSYIRKVNLACEVHTNNLKLQIEWSIYLSGSCSRSTPGCSVRARHSSIDGGKRRCRNRSIGVVPGITGSSFLTGDVVIRIGGEGHRAGEVCILKCSGSSTGHGYSCAADLGANACSYDLNRMCAVVSAHKNSSESMHSDWLRTGSNPHPIPA